MAKGKKQSAKGPAESQDANMNKTTAARSDWRKANMTREQQKHCATIIKAMKQYRNAGPFLDPVDPVKLGIPDYLKIIQHPMDIGTLERKLDNCEYESVSAFADDARLIFNNCYIYNGRDAVISKAAQELEEIFERMMAKMPGQPVAKPAEPSTSKPSKPTEISISKVSEPKRPKREIRPPPPKDYPETPTVRKGSVSKKRDAEMKFLRAIIREFKKKQHAPYAYPFYEPVDAMKLGVPDYYDVIKNPMDISTLNNKLENGQYESADEFEKDVRLMFRNCYAYNPPGSDVYNMGKQLEAIFDRKWKEKPEPMPNPSPETREDTSSSDDEDEQAQSLRALQKSLVALQNQIASIRRKDVKSKNRKQTKSPKGPTRKNSMKGSKDSTSNKKSMAKRARGKADEEDFEPLTVEQKNELGERINRLSEEKTNELIALISASGAHLEAEDGSYELEIESVDDRTARRIYDFVVAHTPKPRQPPAKKPRTHYSEEEQQRKITALEQQLQKFDGKMNGSSGSPPGIYHPMEEDSSASESTDTSGSESDDSVIYTGLGRKRKPSTSQIKSTYKGKVAARRLSKTGKEKTQDSSETATICRKTEKSVTLEPEKPEATEENAEPKSETPDYVRELRNNENFKLSAAAARRVMLESFTQGLEEIDKKQERDIERLLEINRRNEEMINKREQEARLKAEREATERALMEKEKGEEKSRQEKENALWLQSIEEEKAKDRLRRMDLNIRRDWEGESVRAVNYGLHHLWSVRASEKIIKRKLGYLLGFMRMDVADETRRGPKRVADPAFNVATRRLIPVRSCLGTADHKPDYGATKVEDLMQPPDKQQGSSALTTRPSQVARRRFRVPVSPTMVKSAEGRFETIVEWRRSRGS